MSLEIQLRRLQEQQWEWSSNKFPNQTLEGVCNHITSELGEVQAKPQDIIEHADVLLLFLNVCTRDGHKIENVISAAVTKLEEVKKRTDWTAKADGSFQHVRPPFDESEWVPLQVGDIWRNGDVFSDHKREYVVSDSEGDIREGYCVSDHYMQYHPRRRRAMPLGDL